MEQNLQLALKRVEERFAELDRLLAEPDVARDPKKLRDLARERSRLSRTVEAAGEYRRLQQTIADDHDAVASADISGSSTRTSSRASASSFSNFSSCAANSMTGWRRRCSRPSSATLLLSPKVSGLESSRSTSAARASASPSRSRRLRG